MNILEKYFKFENEDKALDFIYEHLDDELKASRYEVVDSYLKSILENEEWWKKCVDFPVFSLAFGIWTGHEPHKFKYREKFLNRLYEDYIKKWGEKRAFNLLFGIKKDLKYKHNV